MIENEGALKNQIKILKSNKQKNRKLMDKVFLQVKHTQK